jgi:hypothetical protein
MKMRNHPAVNLRAMDTCVRVVALGFLIGGATALESAAQVQQAKAQQAPLIATEFGGPDATLKSIQSEKVSGSLA